MVVIIAVIVVVGALLLLTAVLLVILCVYIRRKKREGNHDLAYHGSGNSSLSSLSSCKNEDTPDLAKRMNGRRKHKTMEFKVREDFPDHTEVPFELSGEIRRDDFAAHVAKFDEQRQLLFQEEFDVSGGGGA